MTEFFAMGGYAFYVWGAYVSTAVIMLWEVGSLCRRTQRHKELSDGRNE